MSGFRDHIEATAGPDREALVDGSAGLLVRVRLFDEATDDPNPDAFTNLRPRDARWLARELLAAAADAEQQTRAAGGREPGR